MAYVLVLAMGFGWGYAVRDLMSRRRRASLRKRYLDALAAEGGDAPYGGRAWDPGSRRRGCGEDRLRARGTERTART
jgi:hypothetical protein